MSAQLIRQLINEGKNPLEKSDTLGPMSYSYKYWDIDPKVWEETVTRVKQAMAQEKALENDHQGAHCQVQWWIPRVILP